MTREEELQASRRASDRRGKLYEQIRSAGWTNWHPDDYDPTDEDLERLIDTAVAAELASLRVKLEEAKKALADEVAVLRRNASDEDKDQYCDGCETATYVSKMVADKLEAIARTLETP